MRTDWLPYLRCPECRAAVDFVDLSGRVGNELTEGLLGCGCGMRFPIIGGVPRLLPASRRATLASSYADFFARHPAYRDALGFSGTTGAEAPSVSAVRPPVPLRRTGHPLADCAGAFAAAHARLPASTYANKRLLDAGCGDGLYARFYAERGADVVALAFSEAAADAAYANVRGHERIAVVQGTLAHPPFAEGSFDVVNSAAELPFALRPLAGAASLYALLAPGGRWQCFWRKSHKDESAAAHVATGGLAAIRTLTAHLPKKVVKAALWSAVPALSLLRGRVPTPSAARETHDELSAILTSPPEHRFTRSDLDAWLRSAGLEEISIDEVGGFFGCGRKAALVARVVPSEDDGFVSLASAGVATATGATATGATATGGEHTHAHSDAHAHGDALAAGSEPGDTPGNPAKGAPAAAPSAVAASKRNLSILS